MKIRAMQRVWAVAIALGALGCFAVFLRFQSGPWSGAPSFVPVAGATGFLLSLLGIAYLGRRDGGDAPARWLAWMTKWGSVRRASGTEAGPSDRASAHAIEVGKREPAGTWVLVVDARYLPHGGSDRIVLTLRAEGGGFIERRRAPGRGPPMEVNAPLSPEVSQSIRAELAARGVSQMRDQLEPVLDGLYATFAFVVDGDVQSANLHCGARSVSLAELLRFVADLAPLQED
ncbi:MAG TPA: hypothetical protein VK841_15185 [Polyangiaceae bacterium]|nr:hypothetical protein [Polyangiaceae bacterium]